MAIIASNASIDAGPWTEPARKYCPTIVSHTAFLSSRLFQWIINYRLLLQKKQEQKLPSSALKIAPFCTLVT
jgi:hypothetical protein